MPGPELPTTADDGDAARSRFRRLPDPVRLEDTVETKEATPAPDPAGGRDGERDFMLRYAG